MKIVVMGEPIAQPRQRHRIIGRGEKAFVQNYVPQDHPVHAYKRAIQIQAQLARRRGQQMFFGPLVVELLFVMPRPQALMWKTKPMPRRQHLQKPDIDNLSKAVFDALNELIWKDDSQVIELHASKWIASGNEKPRVEIEISEIEEPSLITNEN